MEFLTGPQRAADGEEAVEDDETVVQQVDIGVTGRLLNSPCESAPDRVTVKLVISRNKGDGCHSV